MVGGVVVYCCCLLLLFIVVVVFRWSEALHGVAVSPGLHLGGNVSFKIKYIIIDLSPPPPSLSLSLSLSLLVDMHDFISTDNYNCFVI